MANSFKPNLHGKIALVVGGTSGIGKGFCEWLATNGASVIVAGRNKQSGEETIELMKKVAPPNLDPAPQYSFAPVDCFLISDTRRFAREIQQHHDRLDYLVLTPGIATIQGRTETAEGIDQKMAVHYYARMAVIDGLLPLLEKTASVDGADVRVLSVLSGGFHSSYTHYRDDPELRQNYSLMNAADATGFYNDIALDSFAREHPTISFTHANPGMVATGIAVGFPRPLQELLRAAWVLFAKSPQQCVQLLAPAFLSPQLQGGFHVMSEYGTMAKVTSLHEQAREFVWDHTKTLLSRFPMST